MAVTEVYEFVVVPADVLHGHETRVHNSQVGPFRGQSALRPQRPVVQASRVAQQNQGRGRRDRRALAAVVVCVCARTVSIWLTAGSSTPRSIMRCTARSAI